jgi:hypothetical protein
MMFDIRCIPRNGYLVVEPYIFKEDISQEKEKPLLVLPAKPDTEIFKTARVIATDGRHPSSQAYWVDDIILVDSRYLQTCRIAEKEFSFIPESHCLARIVKQG